MENSKIEWTHHTFNMWHGCHKVSEGCKNCYAEKQDARFGDSHWGLKTGRKFLSDAHWNKPLLWNRKAEKAGERHRVFCASMADVFEIHPVAEENRKLDAARSRLWKLIEATPHLDWLLLTKRPENQGLVPANWLMELRSPSNVWLGVTAENQEQADLRIPHLLAASWPVVRFVSYEPALELVDFDPPHCQYGCNERYGREIVLGDDGVTPFCAHCDSEMDSGAWLDPLNGGIEWVIAGAESGPGARVMDEDWVRSVRRQCEQDHVPFFFKQRLEGGRKISLPLLDGVQHAEFPSTGES